MPMGAAGFDPATFRVGSGLGTALATRSVPEPSVSVSAGVAPFGSVWIRSASRATLLVSKKVAIWASVVAPRTASERPTAIKPSRRALDRRVYEAVAGDVTRFMATVTVVLGTAAMVGVPVALMHVGCRIVVKVRPGVDVGVDP